MRMITMMMKTMMTRILKIMTMNMIMMITQFFQQVPILICTIMRMITMMTMTMMTRIIMMTMNMMMMTQFFQQVPASFAIMAIFNNIWHFSTSFCIIFILNKISQMSFSKWNSNPIHQITLFRISDISLFI